MSLQSADFGSLREILTCFQQTGTALHRNLHGLPSHFSSTSMGSCEAAHVLFLHKSNVLDLYRSRTQGKARPDACLGRPTAVQRNRLAMPWIV